MINGVLNVYKEAGFTSHDVVAKLRGILKQKKIGHTGTLDPDAVGVLPVCLGKATKLAEMLSGENKTYEAVWLLGVETDTQDSSGTILCKKDVTCSEEDVHAVLRAFLGKQQQIPPMYSARKIGGKHLYDLARQGIEVRREPTEIRIDELTVLSMELPRIRLRVTCSKGTYIRTLCHDMGNRLGCGGCMERLTRTRVGQFQIREAHTLQEIEDDVRKGTLSAHLIEPDALFPDLPRHTVTAEAERTAYHGNGIHPSAIREQPEEPQVLLYDTAGAFLGFYTYHKKQKQYFPEIFFYGA